MQHCLRLSIMALAWAWALTTIVAGGAVWAADQAPAPVDPPAGYELPYKYIGNSFSRKFHRPSCPFAKVMWSKRMELFQMRKQAIDGGYSPCHYCLPQVWTRVQGTIKSLPQKDQGGADATANPEANPESRPGPSPEPAR
jgi:hypothetical protein